MNNKTIKAGQFFTLLFVGRISLTLIYSSTISGVSYTAGFIIPLLLFIPAALILSLPTALFSQVYGGESLCGYAAEKLGTTGRVICVLYGAYFAFSAFCSLGLFRNFVAEALPFGANSQLLLCAVAVGCVFAAVRGIEAAARLSLPVLILVIVCFVLMFVFLFGGYRADSLSAWKYFSFSSSADSLLFLVSRMNGLAAVNALSHHIKGNIKKGTAVFCILYSLAACAVIILFSGAAGDYLSEQHLQSFKAIDGSGVLQRLAPLFILAAVCSLFCNVSLSVIAASECFSLAVRKISFRQAAFASSALMLGGIFVLSDDALMTVLKGTGILAGAAVVFLFLLPLCILIYRRSAKKSSDTSKNGRRKLARLFMFFIIALPVIISMSGCSSLQLDKRLIVQGIGVDDNGGSVMLTAIILDTRDHEQENKSAVIYCAGDSAEDALEQIEQQRGKRLLMSHCRFVIMNERAAQGCAPWLKLLTGRYGAAKTAGLTVACGSSKELITSAIEELGYSVEDISAVTDSRVVGQKAHSVSLFEFISAVNRNEATLTLPYIIKDSATRSLRAEGITVALDLKTF